VTGSQHDPENILNLLDYKRRVFDLYAQIRTLGDSQDAWNRWRRVRRELFKSHPQSPIPKEQQLDYEGPFYFGYEPGLRVLGEVKPTEVEHFDIPTSGDGTQSFTRFANVRFKLRDRSFELDVYWLEGYGGGVFLPFRDTTAGAETYGAGRYLYDTVKGADLGSQRDHLVLDFNFAYNPSCSYDPRWVCPLAPPANRLDVPIRAGERTTPA
jgi:uncharacterized protein (DUF1684 family)